MADERFIDEEQELDRLLAKKRPVRDEQAELDKIGRAREEERRAASAGHDAPQQAKATYAKWQAIHAFVHARPFRLDDSQKRSDQWRKVAARFALLEEPELSDWLALQVDVATSREAGRPDYRERRDGPCFIILLEYVANRKRTALAVLHWATADG